MKPNSTSSAYDVLDEIGEDDEPIDYDVVSHYARNGAKTPKVIAHLMDLPVEWFTDVYKEKVELAMERGLAQLSFEVIGQMRQGAIDGDFQAQKYILQNVDEAWSDKREVINKNEIDIASLPNLRELFAKGISSVRKEVKEEKEINSIEGELDDRT